MMFKTLTTDRDTIERKYHDPEKEFNAYRRMNYHGYAYDEATGLSDEEIQEGLEKLCMKLEGKPHPIYKAELFSYVLDNTRIDVNEHDYFVGMYTWARPISKHSISKWHKEVCDEFAEESAMLGELNRAGVSYGDLDFEHTVPDWDAMMELGFPGLLLRAQNCYHDLETAGTLTQKKQAFFAGMEIEYRAIIRFVDRLYQYALTKSFEKAPAIAKCLKQLRDGAPTNTYEALQLIYLYFMISESVEHYQVRSLGHGLDATLYPFYQKDLAEGTFTKEEIGELIGYFLMQWSAIGNYWGQPFYLAGMHVDRSTKVNELSYMILDIYDRLGIYNPKIQIKVNKTTPKEFVCKALDMIRHGVSSIVFCNDDHIIKALMSRGATYEQAVDAVISGCYEYKIKAKSIGIAGIYYNTLKPISLVFDNGFDTITGKQIGLETGELKELRSFEDFYRAYLKQAEYTMNAYLGALYKLETKVEHVNPSLLFSGTIIDCVETMTDALDRGLENGTGYLPSGLGTAVDALMAVRELVYEKQEVTLEELKKALDADWAGYEELRAKALACKHKYGNGDELSDFYAAALTRFYYDLKAGERNAHDSRYTMEMHSARAFIIHGEKTKATPDGRKLGEETSKNASPTPGADKNGITALINSATTIDTALCNNGFCLDAMLHPTAVQGQEGLEVLYAVLNTYLSKGGASIHFNIFDAELLRDAQKNPAKYQNLQVRVCGWNVLWNNMSKVEQDAYILRAESIA